MPRTLYTIGYERQSVDGYVAALVAARVDVVVDVRQTAWSYRRDFSRAPLERALSVAGIAYIHADFAGNPKEFRAAARNHSECLALFAGYLDDATYVLEMLDLLLVDLMSAGSRVCLTCYERHPEDCHRGILAERWAALRGARISHLAVDPAVPRRVNAEQVELALLE